MKYLEYRDKKLNNTYKYKKPSDPQDELLNPIIEDRKDYQVAITRLKENNTRISYEKIRRESGLED